MADGNRGVRRRRWVRLDAYAIIDLAREVKLSSSEWPVLLAMTLDADFRTKEWAGTVGDLAKSVRMGRNTVARCLANLAELEVIAIIVPFHRNSAGRVEIVVYDELVVPERGRGWSVASNDANDRAEVAQHSRSIRARNAPSGANGQGEQPSERRRGREEGRGVGLGDESAGYASLTEPVTLEIREPTVCARCQERECGCPF